MDDDYKQEIDSIFLKKTTPVDRWNLRARKWFWGSIYIKSKWRYWL